MLGIVEGCVPGKTLDEKLSHLEREEMWLELPNTGPRNLDTLLDHCVVVLTVQAYRLHEYSMVDRDRGERKAALDHVKETIDLARRIGAQRVLVVPGYGFDLCPDPEGTWLTLMTEAALHAKDKGMEIMVESLGPKRTGFHPRFSDIAALVEELDQPNVGLVADTMHIYNSGEDVYETLEKYNGQIKEVQLRDTESLPPGKGDLDFERIIEITRGIPLCLEYTPRDVKEDFKAAVEYVKQWVG